MSWLLLSFIHPRLVNPAKSPDLRVLRFLLDISRLISGVRVLSLTFGRCALVTSWQLVMVGSAIVTAASMASTTFCVLPLSGLEPHDAVGSGTTVGVGVGVSVDVGDCAFAAR